MKTLNEDHHYQELINNNPELPIVRSKKRKGIPTGDQLRPYLQWLSAAAQETNRTSWLGRAEAEI